VTIWDDYIREIEQDLAERRKSLEPLKSGQMRLGERRIGIDPWVDTTEREISAAPLFFAEHGRVDGASRGLEGLPRRLSAVIRLSRCRGLAEIHSR
jgi:hypothetical protein